MNSENEKTSAAWEVNNGWVKTYKAERTAEQAKREAAKRQAKRKG